MKRLLFYCLVLFVISACKKEQNQSIESETTDKEQITKKRNLKGLIVKDIMGADSISVRAITVVHDTLRFAANGGRYGWATENSFATTISDAIDKNKVSFRSIAYNGESIFRLSIGNPALLYKDGILVYKEDHESVFYDAMQFWNTKEGIAIGDPTDGCISIIITRDGGDTWEKLSCESLPKGIEGEAAFAASNTNIAIVGEKTWIATGGKASRVFYSPDKGKSWEVFNTPIIQGVSTTGMYSIAFSDELNGFAIGGDYTKPEDNETNKIRTEDGGKTWELVAENEEPDYRSCVQYIPNSNGEELVAVGFRGISYSNDKGTSWKKLSNESFFTIKFINDSTAYAAGKGRISLLSFKK